MIPNCSVLIDCFCEYRYDIEAKSAEAAKEIAKEHIQWFSYPTGYPEKEIPTGDLMTYDCDLEIVAYNDSPENFLKKTKKYVAIYTAHCTATYYYVAKSKKEAIEKILDSIYADDGKINIDSGDLKILGIGFDDIIFYPEK